MHSVISGSKKTLRPEVNKPLAFFHSIKSPIGDLFLLSNSVALVGVVFSDQWVNFQKENSNLQLIKKRTPILALTETQLREYFAGVRTKFTIDSDLRGTDFQLKAWSVLKTIPFGKTISYQEQCLRMKKPKAMRAVGAANGRNRIPIIIPCHRVVGKSGQLTGYAGGLSIKTFLLELEKNIS
jgi:methylated-DNA-[protein]-cysteine S-methyltransferase